jgi:hypothetical protein
VISIFQKIHPVVPETRALLVYKNMAQNRMTTSHVGLGVTATNIQKHLLVSGVSSDVTPVFDGYELDKILATSNHTHVVMFAPWVDTNFLQGLIRKYPKKFFAVTYHSNVGFLQADAYAVRLLKEQLQLMKINHNFSVGVNSNRLLRSIQLAFGSSVAYLPNAYPVASQNTRSHYSKGQKLRIGIYGAIRPQKNLLSAAWAATIIGSHLGVETEIAINSGRTEGGAAGVLEAVRQLTNNLPHIKLVEAGWNSWPTFREAVHSQNLLISPSYTESFCNVVADGIAEGVPAAVSEAIHWVPDYWKSEPDDVEHIAKVGLSLLFNKKAPSDGFKVLQAYNKETLTAWTKYLQNTLTFIK